VDNAVDHTPAGGEVSITTSTRRRGVVLTVRDTGPGLSAADAERVFERFRSGGQRAGRRHYGLGLALTHEVVLRHGGRLSVLPSERGAAFQLVLPS
jgi:signal transduction histidine kinase